MESTPREVRILSARPSGATRYTIEQDACRGLRAGRKTPKRSRDPEPVAHSRCKAPPGRPGGEGSGLPLLAWAGGSGCLVRSCEASTQARRSTRRAEPRVVGQPEGRTCDLNRTNRTRESSSAARARDTNQCRRGVRRGAVVWCRVVLDGADIEGPTGRVLIRRAAQDTLQRKPVGFPAGRTPSSAIGFGACAPCRAAASPGRRSPWSLE